MNIRIAVICMMCLSTWLAHAAPGTWTSSGPDGGIATDVINAGMPGAFIAPTREGLYRTTDHGATWAPAQSGLGAPALGGNVLVLANGVLYTTGPSCSMLFRSTDAGESWSPTGFDGPGCISSIAVTAGPTPRILLVLLDQPLLASDDGGQTFAPTGSGLPVGASVQAIAASPSQTGVVVATVVAEGAPGIYRSVDSGSSWTPVFDLVVGSGGNFSFGSNGRVYLAAAYDLFRSEDSGATWYAPLDPIPASYVKAHPTQAGNVYWVSNDGVLKESLDSGNSSADISTGNIMANASDRANVFGFAIDDAGGSGDLLVATDGAGLFRRHASAWSAANTGFRAVQIRAFATHASAATRVFAGSDSIGTSPGIHVSADSGTSWESNTIGLRAKDIRSITIDPTTTAAAASTVVYATGRASRTPTGYSSTGLWKSIDGGTTWADIDTGIPLSGFSDTGLIRSFAFDPRSCANPPSVPAVCTTGPLSTMYATSNGVQSTSTPTFRVMKSVDAGGHWTSADGLPQPIVVNDTYLAVTPIPILVNPQNPQELFVGTIATIDPPGTSTIPSGVFRSTDGGTSWQLRSTGLPLAAGSVVTHFDVLALAMDAQTPTTLWASTIDVGTNVRGSVYKSTNGGANWAPSGSGITGGDIRAFAVDPAIPGTLYAAATGLDGIPGGVYRSRDSGATWRSISVGLNDSGAIAIAVHPTDSSRLYAGNSRGVFVLQQLPDGDEDGVPDSIEQAAPNAGDGNADGIADAMQAHVASIDMASVANRWIAEGTNALTGSTGYVTIAVVPDTVGTCAQLVDAQVVDYDTRSADGEGTARYTHRVPNLRFEILDCPGATVRITYPSELIDSADRLRLYGPSSPELADVRWRDLGARATRIDAHTMALTLDEGEFGSYRPAVSHAILFEGGIGSDRIFAGAFD